MQVIDTNTVAAHPALAALSHGTDFLDPQDQQLLAIWGTGTVSTRALAEVLRCHHGTVCRRLRRLRKRLSDPLVRIVSQNLQSLPEHHRQVAILIFIRGERKEVAARILSLSRAELYQIVSEIRGWARARMNANK